MSNFGGRTSKHFWCAVKGDSGSRKIWTRMFGYGLCIINSAAIRGNKKSVSRNAHALARSELINSARFVSNVFQTRGFILNGETGKQVARRLGVSIGESEKFRYRS